MATELELAYDHCQRVAKSEAKNFYYGFRTLPVRQRRSIYAATPSAGSATTSRTAPVRRRIRGDSWPIPASRYYASSEAPYPVRPTLP